MVASSPAITQASAAKIVDMPGVAPDETGKHSVLLLTDGIVLIAISVQKIPNSAPVLETVKAQATAGISGMCLLDY